MLLSVIVGNTEENSDKFSSVPEKDRLIQILSKISSLPLPAVLAAHMPLVKTSNGSTPNPLRSENQNQMSGNASSPSTMDLLAVLSATAGSPSSDAFEIQSQRSTEGSESEKSKSAYVDLAECVNLQRGSMMESPPVGGERSSTGYHSPMEEVDYHAQEMSPSVHLQLFSSSPEDNSAKKMSLGRTYLSSNSSNPSEERSPVSSPPHVHDLFPMQNSRKTVKDVCLSNSGDDLAYVKSTMSNGCSTSLQLFGATIRATENTSIQSSPYRASYTSSGSDHSPSSLNSDAQVFLQHSVFPFSKFCIISCFIIISVS